MGSVVLYQVFVGFNQFLTIVEYILLAYCLMSWFVRPTNQLFQFVSRFVQPLVAPFRPLANKLIERGFMLDLSVLFAFFALRIARSLLWQIYAWLAGMG